MEKCLILFYTTAWSDNVNPQKIALPDGCELTTDRSRYSQAHAVVFHIPTLGRLRWWGLPKKKKDQLWIAWSMESASNYPMLTNRNFMLRFDLTMTYQRSSDVFTPYFKQYGTAREIIGQLTIPAPAKVFEKPIAMFISSSTDRSGRLEYARELMKYIPVDSYGKQLQNKMLSNDEGAQTKLTRVSSYPFTIAFENSLTPDYVTEKFYDPLIAGSVPVYLGAPNVDEYAPGNKCYIDVKDYPTPSKLAEYLQGLLCDRDAYEQFFVWKQQPLRENFLAMLKLCEKDATLRLCEKVIQTRKMQRDSGEGNTFESQSSRHLQA